MENNEIVNKLIKMGRIPANSKLSDEDFKRYDMLLASFEDKLSFEEAEQIINLFSEDCDDLNWTLLHLIESVPYNEVDRYKRLISVCPNKEFKEILEKRYSNWLNK